MYRAGRLRRVFRARGKLVGTSDFVVTKGYVQIRVVGFPWETASLEAVVRRQDGALLLRRERAEARLWVYPRRWPPVNNDRYAIRTRNLQDWNLTRYRCANRSKGCQRWTPPRYVRGKRERARRRGRLRREGRSPTKHC